MTHDQETGTMDRLDFLAPILNGGFSYYTSGRKISGAENKHDF